MIFSVERDVEKTFPFDEEALFPVIGEAVLRAEHCPFEAEVSLTLTDDDGIRAVNLQTRELDKVTDVLSFPNLTLSAPAAFKEALKTQYHDCFDPDTGHVFLGDVLLNTDAVFRQAEAYGHSVRREFAFLVVHSLLHLCGYDHMEPADRALMEERQEEVLTALAITRDDAG